MPRKELKVCCVFAPEGQELNVLIEQSFRLYLRRTAAEQDEPGLRRTQEGTWI